ncbi:MAG: hypothetical protein ACREOO_00415 [bacterium]
MGQQQLLLVIMSALIVGIAIMVGITMYFENSKQAHQADVRDGLVTIAARAQGWYRRPASLGGGARSFGAIEWAKINFKPETDSGIFELSNKLQDSFHVKGVSREDTTWSLTLIVYPDSIALAP